MSELQESYTVEQQQPVYSRQWRRAVARLQELQKAGTERVIIEFTSQVEWIIVPLDDSRAIGIKP